MGNLMPAARWAGSDYPRPSNVATVIPRPLRTECTILLAYAGTRWSQRRPCSRGHGDPERRPGVTIQFVSTAPTAVLPPSGAARPRLTFLGTGYLGATYSICFAEMGYEVLGFDVNTAKIAPRIPPARIAGRSRCPSGRPSTINAWSGRVIVSLWPSNTGYTGSAT